MKTMKNFAAQQLSKKEMNNVKGGKRFLCICNWGEGEITIIPQQSPIYITDNLELAIFRTRLVCVHGGTCNAF